MIEGASVNEYQLFKLKVNYLNVPFFSDTTSNELYLPPNASTLSISKELNTIRIELMNL